MTIGYHHLVHIRIVAVLVLALFLGFAAADETIADSPWDAKKPTIVLDPGHGGNDQGALGPGGKTEKTIMLGLARQLKAQLTLDYRVELTRKDDYAVDNNERAVIANQLKADLFISLHAGASFRPHAQGIIIFYAQTSGPESGHANDGKDVTTEENRQMWQELQAAHIFNSRRLAENVKKSFAVQFPDMACRIRQAPVAVLQGVDTPAILIEGGYLTNPAWEQAVNENGYRTAFLAAIANGIKEFLPSQP
jgi:N-acetylmuramoyl-L-alanine amidase